MTHYIPAWEDSKGNRFFVVARNHKFTSRDEAVNFQLSQFVNYVPFGWITSGIFEIDLDENDVSTGEVPNVAVKGPFNFDLCVIGGPVFDQAMDQYKEGVSA